MGFRFRKSINLGGGFRLNLGKRGIGLSAGIKGLRFGINSRGRVHGSIGLPGTGLSYTKSASLKKASKAKASEPGCLAIIGGFLFILVAYSIWPPLAIVAVIILLGVGKEVLGMLIDLVGLVIGIARIIGLLFVALFEWITGPKASKSIPCESGSAKDKEA